MLMDLHMHSKYSDGENTPEEMINAAIEIGYDTIAITDHVWKSSLWIPEYAIHLESLKEKFKKRIRIYSGVEAKVLSLHGDIDADPSFDSQVDLVLGSFHRIPGPDGFFSKRDVNCFSKDWIVKHWLISFYQMLKNPRVDIIAHPLSELRGFGVTNEDIPILEIVEQIVQSGKIMELNVRYNTPEEPVIQLTARRGVPILVSSDSHSVRDLIANSNRVKEISRNHFEAFDIHDYISRKKCE